MRTLRAPKMCQVDGCERESRIRGVCGPHDYRILIHGDPHYSGPDPHAVRRPRADRRPQPRKVCLEPGCGLLVFSAHRCQPHFVTAYLDAIPAGCYA